MNNITQDNYDKINKKLILVIDKIKEADKEANTEKIKSLINIGENLLLLLYVIDNILLKN